MTVDPRTLVTAPDGLEFRRDLTAGRWELGRIPGDYEVWQPISWVSDEWLGTSPAPVVARWLLAMFDSIAGRPLTVDCGGCRFEAVWWAHIEAGPSPQPPTVCPRCGAKTTVRLPPVPVM